MIASIFSAARFARPAAATCVSVRYASLSAIHRGLRRSERVQYGSTRPRDDDRRSNDFEPRSRSSSTRLTDRALGGAASDRQRQKLRKKLSRKEAEEEEDDEDGRQTRRKRFTNPDFEFGKTSLVYEMKHGALKDKLDKFQQVRRDDLRTYQVDKRPTRDFRGRDRQPDREPRERQPERQWRGRDDREPRRDDRDRTYDRRRDRDDREPRRDDRDRTYDRRRDRGDRGRDRDEDRPSSRPTETNDISSKMRSARRDTTSAPTTTIRYTTAASQFLYGRSVVHSALSQSRRQLYKLYVQTGENRSPDETLTALATSKGVTVQQVPSSEQHVMDKISMGRPHNGYILETSPLPQLPATSLGALEETPAKLGFHVEIAHQTREELDINGTNTFFKRAGRTAKPFVLLLHEIGDPGNLGGMLRTASYLGVDAVAITSRSSSGLTPVVLKSAAGAVEEIPILRVDSPVEFLNKSREHGWKTYAAVAPPDRTLARRHGDKFVSLEDVEAAKPLDDSPCILVMGNEGHGLPKAVKVAADYELSVPHFVHESCVDSLNVSVAAGVLAHAFVRAAVPQAKVRTAAAVEDVSEEPKETFF